jgi:tetratricopeptide (TPR) repeat protein/cold shock CspA family protein
LIELFKTTLVSREIVDVSNLEEVYFYIPDFAKEFLSFTHPVDPEFVKQITRKSRELSSGIQDIKKVNSFNEFSVNALDCETPNQRIAAKLLSEALKYSKGNDYQNAFKKVNEAKNVDPNYYEVYRVGGFLKATKGDTLGAEEDYLQGLEIAPENPRLLYYYAQFLLFHLEDIKKALECADLVFKLKPEHPFSSFLYVRCYNVSKEYNKAIQIIKNLISNTELDPLNLRVAYTELISLYSNSGQSYLKVQSDIDSGISHFKKSFEVFGTCVDKNIVDTKMLKNFSDALYTFLMMLPPTEIENNHEYVHGLIEKYKKQISLTYLSRKVILKYSEKYNDKSLNYIIDEQDSGNGNKVGNIIKTHNDSYVFIESENERYFAHFTDFPEIRTTNELKRIKEGQLVTFEEGSNSKGVCAKNIKIAII